jgi:integrase
MNHLKIINHNYYFRLCIPQDLKAIFGCCEIKRSLATSDYKRANIIASTLAHRLKDIITMARTKPSTLDSDQIKALVDTHIKKVMESLEHRSLTRPPTTIDQAKEEAIHISEMQGDYEEALATRSWHVVDHLVDNLLEGREVDKMSRTKLSRELLGAVVKLHSVMESHALGDYDGMMPGVGVQPEVIPEITSISLGDLADAYEKDKRGSWSPSAVNKWNGYRKVFFRFHDPATQAHTITRRAFYEYRELLRCLPKAFMTTKKYDGKTAEDVKALDVPNPIDPKTVNGHVIFLHGMFKLAVNKLGDITTNPASDMLVPIKGDARKLRDMFTLVDLETIYNSSGFMDAKHPYQFWVTVLSLFTGSRREELCNLYSDDIKKEDGVWYIDITADKPDKRIKTFQIRTVPIHPFVIELGFIDYVRSFEKGQRIWPELNNNNQDQKYGHYYGRWFNDNLLKPLDIKPTKAEKADGAALKDHHSFRHTLINVGIRAGMDVQKVKGLVGHKEKGTTFETYFKGFTVKQIYDEVISQIDHGVDLDHLKKHRFARHNNRDIDPTTLTEKRNHHENQN